MRAHTADGIVFEGQPLPDIALEIRVGKVNALEALGTRQAATQINTWQAFTSAPFIDQSVDVTIGRLLLYLLDFLVLLQVGISLSGAATGRGTALPESVPFLHR